MGLHLAIRRFIVALTRVATSSHIRLAPDPFVRHRLWSPPTYMISIAPSLARVITPPTSLIALSTNMQRLPANIVGFSCRFGPAPAPINSLASSTMSLKFQQMKRIGVGVPFI
eukprot:6650769-Pyramimonas_sp.AAC.1